MGSHPGIARLQSEAEARLGVLAAGLREYAIVVLDTAGRVQRWDEAVEHVLGYRAEEIIGEHISVLAPGEQTATDHAQWQLARAAEFGSHVDEGWRRRRDGTHFWAHMVTTLRRRIPDHLFGR